MGTFVLGVAIGSKQFHKTLFCKFRKKKLKNRKNINLEKKTDFKQKRNEEKKSVSFFQKASYIRKRKKRSATTVTYEGHNPKRATVLLSNKLINN